MDHFGRVGLTPYGSKGCSDALCFAGWPLPRVKGMDVDRPLGKQFGGQAVLAFDVFIQVIIPPDEDDAGDESVGGVIVIKLYRKVCPGKTGEYKRATTKRAGRVKQSLRIVFLFRILAFAIACIRGG